MRIIRALCISLFLCAPIAFAFGASVKKDPLQRYGLGRLNWKGLSFSPSGNHVYTCCGMGAGLFDARSNETLRLFPMYPGSSAAVMSPDEKKMAIAKNPLVSPTNTPGYIYDTESAKSLLTLAGNFGGVGELIYSADGTVLFGMENYYDSTTGNHENRVVLWDAATGGLIRDFPTPTGWEAVGMAVASSDPLLAISYASYGGTGDYGHVRIYNWQSEQLLSTLQTYDQLGDTIFMLKFFDQDRKIMTASTMGQVHLWNLETNPPTRFKDTTSQNGYTSVSSDGAKILMRTIDGTELRSVSNDALIQSYPGLFVNSVNAISPDDSRAVMFGEDLRVAVVELESGIEVAQHNRFNGAIDGMALSPDGTKVALSRSANIAPDQMVPILDVVTGEISSTLPVGGNTQSAAFSPDGSQLLLSGEETTLWDVASNCRLKTLPTRSGKACFLPNGHQALTVAGWQFWSDADSKKAILWDLDSGTELHAFTGHPDPIRFAAVSPDGKLAITCSDDVFTGPGSTSIIWDLTNFTQRHSFTDTETVFSAAFSPDSTKVLIGTSNGGLRLQTVDGALVRNFAAGSRIIQHVGFNSIGSQVAAAVNTTQVWIWNADNGSLLRKFNGHNDAVTNFAFTPNDNRLVSVSYDGLGLLWSNEWLQARITDKLLIVAGSYADHDSAPAKSAKSLADWACKTAVIRGYSSGNIRYLSAIDTPVSNSMVYGAATAASIQTALSTWAADSSQLVVLIVGSGQKIANESCFVLGGDSSAPVTVSATQLAAWLNTAQGGTAPLPEIHVILDTDYASGFLPALAPVPAGTSRIVMASSSADQKAFFGTGKGLKPGFPSFTSYFFSGAFLGDTIWECFDRSKRALESLPMPEGETQNCLLDDNGDGVFDSNDGTVARTSVFGQLPEFGFRDVTISNCSTTTNLRENGSATIEVGLDVPAEVDVNRVEAFATRIDDPSGEMIPIALEETPSGVAAGPAPKSGATLHPQYTAAIPEAICGQPGVYKVLFSAVRDDGLGVEMYSDPASGTITVEPLAKVKAFLDY